MTAYRGMQCTHDNDRLGGDWCRIPTFMPHRGEKRCNYGKATSEETEVTPVSSLAMVINPSSVERRLCDHRADVVGSIECTPDETARAVTTPIGMERVRSMSELTECPTCGRDDFKNEHGMRTHHGHAHSNSIAKEVVECGWCGAEFQKYRCRVEKYDRHFCDNDCLDKYWSEQKNIIVDCGWCGEEFQKKRSFVEKSDHHFCDSDCWNEYRSDQGIVSVSCDWCGEEFQKCRSKVEEYDHHFCDSSCWGEWWSESIRGDDHHRWVGGMVSYGKGWNKEKREQVRERQDRTCVGCGIHESEAGRRLDVHHIEKARSITDPEERNAVENLVGLCQTCHKRWEKMSPLRPQTVWGESV